MSLPQVRKVWKQGGIALMLALVGGYVDAVGYLVLLHVFTAHMSGNSIAMGIHLAQGEWSKALHRGFPIPLFVIGVMVGAALGEILSRRQWRSRFCLLFVLESGLLVVWLIWGSRLMHSGELQATLNGMDDAVAVLPALAMGLQNATLRRVGNTTVRTTYITGMLTDAGEFLVSWLRRLGGYWRHQHHSLLLARASWRDARLHKAVLLLGLWLVYVIGAIGGTCAEQRWKLSCVLVPVVCLAILAAVDYLRPLAGQEPKGT